MTVTDPESRSGSSRLSGTPVGHEALGDVRERRRDALLQDAVLFCLAFSAGAAIFASLALVREVARDAAVGWSESLWTIGLSQDLMLAGLLSGEAFCLWNNGLRQGRRGHSVGKHRYGLRVVDITTEAPAGGARGLGRGLAVVVLLDLSLAALPLGLPTALRRLTPESWHVGAAAYVAVVLLAIPLVVPAWRTAVDRVARTRVDIASGEGAATSSSRQRALRWLDGAAVLGVLLVTGVYLSFFWPLIGRVPSLW